MIRSRVVQFIRKKIPLYGFEVLFCILLLLVGIGMRQNTEAATAPPILTYQGKILDNGSAVTTTRPFMFLLYDASSGGNLLYTASGTIGSPTTTDLTPSQGIFSVLLGTSSTNAIATSTFLNNHTLYLEVRVGGTTLTPRKRLTSVPYALNTEYLMGLSASSTSSSTYIPHSDENGNFRFTGVPQSSGVGGGVLYINPTTTIANRTLFGIGLGGAERFRVDAEGDTWVQSVLTVAATSTLASTTVNGGFFVGATQESITTSSFVMNSNDAYFADQVGIKGNLFVENDIYVGTSTLHISGNTEGGLINMDGGSLTIDSSGRLNINTTNNKNIIFGSGSIGVNTSTPVAMFSVAGQSYLSATATIQDIVAVNSITLGGETRTTWGGGASLTANQTFTGLNSFSATTTLASTTVSGTLNVGDGVLFVDPVTRRVGINSSSPNYNFSVSGTSYFSATTTFADIVLAKGKIASPTTTGRISAGVFDSITSLKVRGNYAYGVDPSGNSLVIVDITNPNNPQYVNAYVDSGSTNFAGPASVDVVGNYAYVVNDGEASDGLTIFDISNPNDIQIVGSLKDNATTALNGGFDIYVSGNYAYIASFDENALEIVDISNPASPRHVGKIVDDVSTTLTTPWTVYVQGKYAYVGSFGGDGLEIVDISDPANPTHVSSIVDNGSTSLDGPQSVFVQGNYAYVLANLDNSLEIIDIHDPKNPTHVASYVDNSVTNHSSPSEVTVSGNYAYVVGGGGLEVVDISSTTVPTHVGGIAGNAGNGLSGYNSIAIQGNYAYIANQNFVVVDISGIEISNTNIGNARIANLQVTNPSFFENSLYARGGLIVGNNGLLLNGDLSISAPTSSLTATSTVRFSNITEFRSGVTTTARNAFIFDTQNTVSTSVSNQFLLSVRNNGTKTFSISTNGNVHTTGTYFGAAVAVSTPGAPGDLAERVDIAIDDSVEPGDVMIVDANGTDTYRRSQKAYEQGVAGVISTNPTIVVGDGKTEHKAILAMVGRVPVKVSTENGAIKRGDLLVSASIPGYAMKYDATKDDGLNIVGVIGVALESQDSGTGKIMALIRTGWVNNRHATIAQIHQDLMTVAVAGGVEIAREPEQLQVQVQPNGKIGPITENLNMNGFYIVNVAGLFGKNDAWAIDEEGRFITKVQTTNGKKSLYSLQSGETEYIFSGSSQLQNGEAKIEFDEVTKQIIDAEKPMKINITLTSEANGIYVSTKDANGFVARELQGGTSHATFDWVVIAQRKNGLPPLPDQVNLNVPPEQNVPAENNSSSGAENNGGGGAQPENPSTEQPAQNSQESNAQPSGENSTPPNDTSEQPPAEIQQTPPAQQNPPVENNTPPAQPTSENPPVEVSVNPPAEVLADTPPQP